MKKGLLIIIITSMVVVMGCANRSDKNMIKVITLNIRLDTPRDSLNAWPYRADFVCDYLTREKPDLLGMQEVLLHQFQVLDSVLVGYGSIGVGRTDGGKGGEMNPIFYNKDRFEMVRTKTFWLSETPDSAGSQAWGAGLPRIVTWVELVDKRSQKHLYFFNTHFAHDSEEARVNSAKLLIKSVDSITVDVPFVVTGDFNMNNQSEGYKVLTRPFESVPLFVDTYSISEREPQGLHYSYNAFKDEPGKELIDFIFVRKGMKVYTHDIPEVKDYNLFLSDHWPVISTISIE